MPISHTLKHLRMCISSLVRDLLDGCNDSSLWCKGWEMNAPSPDFTGVLCYPVLESVVLHVRQIVSPELPQPNKTYHISLIPNAFCLCFTRHELHLVYHVPWFEVFLHICHNGAVYKPEIPVCLGSFFCWTPKSMLTVNQNGLLA